MNLQSSLVFLYANLLYVGLFFWSLSIAYNEVHLYVPWRRFFEITFVHLLNYSALRSTDYHSTASDVQAEGPGRLRLQGRAVGQGLQEDVGEISSGLYDSQFIPFLHISSKKLARLCNETQNCSVC